MPRPGIEPTICRLRVRDPTTTPPSHLRVQMLLLNVSIFGRLCICEQLLLAVHHCDVDIALVCYVLCCHEGFCYLKSSDVLKLLLDILSDDWKCEVYGPELTNLILKDVLSTRSSWFSLSASICQGKSVSENCTVTFLIVFPHVIN